MCNDMEKYKTTGQMHAKTLMQQCRGRQGVNATLIRRYVGNHARNGPICNFENMLDLNAKQKKYASTSLLNFRTNMQLDLTVGF